MSVCCYDRLTLPFRKALGSVAMTRLEVSHDRKRLVFRLRRALAKAS
jgi:hypothetical protein